MKRKKEEKMPLFRQGNHFCEVTRLLSVGALECVLKQ